MRQAQPPSLSSLESLLRPWGAGRPKQSPPGLPGAQGMKPLPTQPSSHRLPRMGQVCSCRPALNFTHGLRGATVEPYTACGDLQSHFCGLPPHRPTDQPRHCSFD